MGDSSQAILDHDFAVCATTSYDDDGFLVAGTDAYGAGGDTPAEILHPFGFMSRPLDPTVDAAGNVVMGCTMFSIGEGSRKAVMALSDPNVIAIVTTLAQLAKGDSMQYCGADGTFIKLTGSGSQKGRIGIGTRDSDGQDMGTLYDPSGEITHFGSFGTMSLGTDGFHVITKGGTSLMMGGVAGPGVPSIGGAFFQVETATVNLTAPVVKLGKSETPQQPVVLATALMTALQTIATALESLAEGVAALGATPAVPTNPPTGVPSVATTLGSIAAAVAAASAAIGPADGGQPLYASGTTVSS